MLDKQKQAQARNKLQEETLPQTKNHKHILLKWTTGVSKTLMAIKIAISISPNKILINTKEISHKDTWEKEFKKWGYDNLWQKVTIICYASLHTIEGEQFDVIINDECHGISELREDYLGRMEGWKKMISLSATPGEEVEERLAKIHPYWESIVTTEEAIELGILPEPTIYVVEVELDDKIKRHTIKKGSRTNRYTDKAYYTYLTTQIKRYQEIFENTGEGWAMQRMVRAGNVRKVFMALCKTEKVKEILSKVKEKRYMCFTGSIEQCNELGGRNAIHSMISVNKRKKIMEDFNNKLIDNVFSVNMLKESVNVEDIEAGLMVQVDAKTDRGSLQALGRTLRGDEPEFYFFKLINTVDDKWVAKALSSFSNKYIKVYEEKKTST